MEAELPDKIVNVSNVASSGNAYQPDSTLKKRAQSFKDLASALNKGDLSAAKVALANLQPSSNAKGQAPQSGPKGPITQDFSALSNALQSGNLSAAQQAFATLQKDAKTMHGHHHRPETDSGNTLPPAPASSGSVGTNIDQLA